MRRLLIALVCILTVSIGMTASSAPFDTSPNIECTSVIPNFDVADFTDVTEAPCFDLANVVYLPTSIEGVNFCLVILPNCIGEPDNSYGAINTETPTLANNNILIPDLLAESDLCVTNDKPDLPFITTLSSPTLSNNYYCSPTDGESAECMNANGADESTETTNLLKHWAVS